MSYFFDDVILPCLLFVGLIAAVLGGIFALVVAVDYLDCQGFNKGTGIETRWHWGCYAKVDDQWVPKQYAFGSAHEVRIKDKR
jgi:hypothetical protein